MGDFDLAGFSSGFGAVVLAFFTAWVLGLVAKMLDVGCE